MSKNTRQRSYMALKDFRENTAWAGGLFEGEGCVYNSRNTPGLVVEMSDHDTLLRFASLFPFGTVRPGSRKRLTTRPTLRWATFGHENVQAFVAMVWPWLGERRRNKAREVLKLWRLRNAA